MKIWLLALLAIIGLSKADRDRRGVVEEVGKLFDGLQSGIDHFQAATRHEVLQ